MPLHRLNPRFLPRRNVLQMFEVSALMMYVIP
jgi:hypothetical protein